MRINLCEAIFLVGLVLLAAKLVLLDSGGFCQVQSRHPIGGLWRSWERASIALMRSRVRIPPGPLV